MHENMHRGECVPRYGGSRSSGMQRCGDLSMRISSYSPGVDEAFAVSGILPPPSAMLFRGIPSAGACCRRVVCPDRGLWGLRERSLMPVSAFIPSFRSEQHRYGISSGQSRVVSEGLSVSNVSVPTRMASVMALSLCMSVMEREKRRLRALRRGARQCIRRRFPPT